MLFLFTVQKGKGDMKMSAREASKPVWAQKNNSEQVKKIELLRELDSLEKK